MRAITMLLAALLLFIINQISAQDTQWMSKRTTSTEMVLDPTEVQVSGSITAITNYSLSERQYLPFSIGFDQSIYTKQLSENKAWEVLGEFGSFTQFEWKKVDGIQQRNLINIDYKIAFSYVRQIDKKSTYRIRFFHVSSHRGDDFIFREQIRSLTENKVNYEQLEATYFHNLNSNKNLYIGFGSVVRPNSIRKALSAHLGAQFDFRKLEKAWVPTAGFNVKVFQETDFDPNVKLGAGMAYFYAKRKEPLRLIAELYSGHLPYSQYESRTLTWIGLGLYFKV